MGIPSSLAAARSTSATNAVVVDWIAVGLDVIGAVSLFLVAGSDTLLGTNGLDAATVRGAAIGSLVLAAILALVVRGLGRGGSVARRRDLCDSAADRLRIWGRSSRSARTT